MKWPLVAIAAGAGGILVELALIELLAWLQHQARK
jgi:hypothetical protein